MNQHPPSLAERIRGDVPAIGLLVKMPNPAAVELAGWLGYDFVIIDTEHGDSTSSELEHHLRAARIPALIRVATRGPEIPRALDAGAEGVIVPHVNDRHDAELAVASAHYSPVGERGLAISTRAGHQGTVGVTQHIADALRGTLVVGQIEDEKAVRNAAEIAATPHLNAVWIGPSDLSLSMGIPGEFDHPALVEAIETTCAEVRRAKGAALCAIANGPDEAAEWVRRGASMLIHTAHSVFANELQRLLDQTRAATTRT
jgi:4-hydroxy-2-oxoheptanedioate aldolase